MRSFNTDWFQDLVNSICLDRNLPNTTVEVKFALAGRSAKVDLTFTCGDEVSRLHNVFASEYEAENVEAHVLDWHKEIGSYPRIR